jgi:hypothetical protein
MEPAVKFHTWFKPYGDLLIWYSKLFTALGISAGVITYLIGGWLTHNWQSWLPSVLVMLPQPIVYALITTEKRPHQPPRQRLKEMIFRAIIVFPPLLTYAVVAFAVTLHLDRWLTCGSAAMSLMSVFICGGSFVMRLATTLLELMDESELEQLESIKHLYQCVQDLGEHALSHDNVTKSQDTLNSTVTRALEALVKHTEPLRLPAGEDATGKSP